MRAAPVVVRVAAPYALRVANLLGDYAEDAAADPAAVTSRLRDATKLVAKRLGADDTARALALLDRGDLAARGPRGRPALVGFAGHRRRSAARPRVPDGSRARGGAATRRFRAAAATRRFPGRVTASAAPPRSTASPDESPRPRRRRDPTPAGVRAPAA